MARNPWLAAALSFLMAGLGQFYVGQTLKGFVFMTLNAVIVYVSLYVSESAAIGLSLVVGVVSVFDAYYGAKKALPAGISGGEALEEPEVRVF
jgi:TM2 domain-containing membrane protein YozV